MKKLLFALATLPLLAGIALAAGPLSDVQMDLVTAGQQSCTGVVCTTGSITFTTTTVTNGVPTTTFGEVAPGSAIVTPPSSASGAITSSSTNTTATASGTGSCFASTNCNATPTGSSPFTVPVGTSGAATFAALTSFLGGFCQFTPGAPGC